MKDELEAFLRFSTFKAKGRRSSQVMVQWADTQHNCHPCSWLSNNCSKLQSLGKEDLKVFSLNINHQLKLLQSYLTSQLYDRQWTVWAA